MYDREFSVRKRFVIQIDVLCVLEDCTGLPSAAGIDVCLINSILEKHHVAIAETGTAFEMFRRRFPWTMSTRTERMPLHCNSMQINAKYVVLARCQLYILLTEIKYVPALKAPVRRAMPAATAPPALHSPLGVNQPGDYSCICEARLTRGTVSADKVQKLPSPTGQTKSTVRLRSHQAHSQLTLLSARRMTGYSREWVVM